MLLDWLFSDRQRTFALVGESGTGKSYFAQSVADKIGAEFIIDDGLLIRKNRIVAGKSVKEEKSFIAAVKAALFADKGRRDEVARKLLAERWRRILILGTSAKMVRRIAARLQIPAPERIIRIEDVASEEDIDTALRRRRIEGKHVIPAPQTEVRQSYPGIFYDTVATVQKKRFLPRSLPAFVPKAHERSIVRPEYSKRNKIIISEWALSQMITYCISEYNPSIVVKKISVNDEADYKIAITVDIPFGSQLTGSIGEMRAWIIENIERFTGILIEEVSIIIDKIADKL